MKRIFTLFSILAFVSFSFAQTAPDFTITTTDGISRNLYNTLDSGKTIILDFFYPSCQSCYYYAPVIEQSYQGNGAGSGNVQYWGINGGVYSNDAQIIAYRTQYGITNPCASGLQGNGRYVDSLYQVAMGSFSYVKYAVVCPDHHIYWDVNYPPVATGFDAYINDSCGAFMGMNRAKNLNESIRIFPNPVATDASFKISNISNAVSIVFMAADGRIVKSILKPAASVLEIDADAFSSGLYLCMVTKTDGSMQLASFIVQE